MSWQDSLFLDGTNIDADLRDLVTSIVLTRTMEGAESLDITIRDEAMDFLVSGVLARPGNAPYTVSKQLKEAAWDRFGRALLTLDGVFFRLAGVQGNYAAPPWTLTLTFESEIATLMRQKTRAVKSSRNQSTRAQFVRYLATLSQRSDLTEHGLPTFATVTPDAEKRDPQAKPKDADRNKGLSKSAHLTINGIPITSEQRRNLTISLTEAQKHNAIELVYLSMLCAGIGESGFTVIPNQDGSDYGGVFQGKFKGADPQFKIGDTKGMADSFLLGGRGFQAGGAIKLAATQPTLTPGQIAYMVEGDLSNFQGDTARAAAFYQQHLGEAQDILAAWGGAIGSTVTVRESYEYKAGGPKAGGGHENYWAATERLASEVRWRRFASANWLYFGPDEFFFQNQPSFVIDSTAGSNPPTNRGKQGLADQGVLSLGFTADVGMPASEVNVTILAPAWTTSPGATFQFDYMGPLTGRWLIWQSKQDLTLDIDRADLILRAPAPQKKEPAPQTRKRATGPSSQLSGITLDPKTWGGAQSILDNFVTPFMQARGLQPGNTKRTPGQNAEAGGAGDSDHLTTEQLSYAIDYPTTSGEDDARALARAMGNNDWQPNVYGRFNVSIGGYTFRIQILWGALIQHGDHVHVGARRTGTATTTTREPSDGALWLPGATRVPMADAGTFTGGGWKIVHHTTEGSSISGAESAFRANRDAPHFCYDHDTDTVHQYVPMNRASRSLRHGAGTPETNRANAIQVEHVGFTSQCAGWSGTAYANIAALCRSIEAATGVPRASTVLFGPPIPPRMSGAAWVAYEGHCGHVHAPAPNDHVDPTGFKISSVI